MFYRATEDLFIGDHVAVVEKPNKIGKCNDPAASGYLGILREAVSAGKKVEDIHITSLEQELETSIKVKQVPTDKKSPTVRVVGKGRPKRSAEEVLTNPPVFSEDNEDDSMGAQDSNQVPDEEGDQVEQKKPWWRWGK